MVPKIYVYKISQLEIEERVKNAILYHPLQEKNGYPKNKSQHFAQVRKMFRQLRLCVLKKHLTLLKEMKMEKFSVWFFTAFIFGALILSGCAEQVVAAGTGEELPSPYAEFILKSGIVDGRMVYVGVGGDIDGRVNPDLIVQAGSSVIITLANGDGMQHDLVIPDLNFKTPLVSSKEDKVGVVFEVGEGQSGTYPYFCSVAGHRQAGMEGKIIVNQP